MSRWPDITIEERFMNHVYKNPDTQCWDWTGHVHKGYSRFNRGDKTVDGHRWSYIHFIGNVPDGLQLDHLCRNRACVNPNHLEPVTSKENSLRGIGAAAIRAAQTYCLRGHKFDERNTRLVGKNQRRCLACHAYREKMRRSRAKLKS